MNEFYTGIGSREAQDYPEVMNRCQEFAKFCRASGLVLRSGGAEGCDQAFQMGADELAEIWLPWDGFCGWHTKDNEKFHLLSQTQTLMATELTLQFHPKCRPMTHSNRQWWALMNRNAAQILGPNLSYATARERSKFVACWTPTGQDTGGTAQAIRIARWLDIPVFNFFHKDQEEKAYRMVDMMMY